MQVFKKKKRIASIEPAIQKLIVNQDLRSIRKAYNLSIHDIKDICEALEICGAGTWVNDNYVAIQSLITADTLEFIAKHYKDGRFQFEGKNHFTSMFFAADQLINYFKDKNQADEP